MSNYNPYTKRQTMIAPDYEVYRYRSTYMNEVELHHHDFYEIYLLLRGRVEYIVENQLYRVRPGDWMLCSPLELHQARIATDADAYERIVLWIARPYLEGLSTRPHEPSAAARGHRRAAAHNGGQAVRVKGGQGVWQ